MSFDTDTLIQTSKTLLEKAQEFLIDNGLYLDLPLRLGVRALLNLRRRQLAQVYKESENVETFVDQKWAYVHDLIQLEKIAVYTDKANEQHYMVDTEFFKLCLGKRLKYSSCYFPPGVNSLDKAEEAMLELYCDRAGLMDGMRILDLGCGWGSLTLYLCEKYPNARISSLSNSSSQREHIESICKEKGYENVQVITADINEWTSTETFDRIVTVEMIEHTKNIKSLFKKLSKLLRKESHPKFGTGSLFVHIFCHKSSPYHFDTTDDQSWMARYFFSGGTMPSHDLLLHFQEDLAVVKTWAVNGTHYGKTSRAWLNNMDKNVGKMNEVMSGYGKGEEKKWWNRWRVFYIAVEELFNYNNGNEWFVGHYLLKRKESD